jgi:ribosomal protein L11 methyltransferase
MWYSVSMQAAADVAEALSEALMDAGALSVSIEDADAGTDRETPQFGEPGSINERLWSQSVVIALFDPEADLPVMLAQAAGAVGLESVPDFNVEEVPEQNWVQVTQGQFEPIRITDRLWIVPSWHQAPDADAINIEVDPGMAFGTGSHPTTRLCLQWLCDTVSAGASVLDYGCGSGILGIAAAKLGATQVTGCDIDEIAVATAAANATRNGVSNACWMHSAKRLEGQYDMVVANILTNPLCILAPHLVAHVKPGGLLALSGVLAIQAEQVIDAYAPYIGLVVGAEHEGWIRLEGRKAC